MKRVLLIMLIFILIIAVAACGNNNGYAETSSTVIRKEIKDGNQHYFYVEYEIEGREGLYEATIKVQNRNIYDKYEVGDTYVFSAPYKLVVRLNTQVIKMSLP
jgi:hypothetical protein